MTLRDEVTQTINPGDDFYQYVNKKWLDAHPIPADKSRFGAFTELDETVNAQLRTLLESPAAADEPYTVALES
jgi:putative endopeptidase